MSAKKTKPQTKPVYEETEADIPSKSPRTLWYVLLLICAVVALAGSTFLALEKPLMGWEQRVFQYINNFPDSWRTAAVVITYIGSTWLAVAAVVITFFSKMYWLSWRLAFSTLAGYGAIYFLKHWVDRPRPEFLYPDPHLRIGETLAGFPSGHSMIVTVVVLTLLPFLPKIWRWIIAGLAIAFVGWSRVYLGVHAPLDIVGGIAVGVIVVCVVRLMPQKIRHFFRLG